MDNNFFVSGKLTGNGAAKTVSLGFKPKRVTVYDVTNNLTFIWTDSMADAKAVKTIADGTQSYVAADMITPFAGSASASAGFTMGATLYANAAELHYVAER